MNRLFIFATIALAVLPGLNLPHLVQAGPDAKAGPKPLPPEVVKACTNAGADYFFRRVREVGDLEVAREAPPPGALLLTGAQTTAQEPGDDVTKLKGRIEKLEAEIAALKQAVAPGPHQNMMRELAPLKQWAGSWKGESKQDNKWDYRHTAKTEWVMTGFFLQTTYSLERVAPPHKMHGMEMMSYDPAQEKFRHWRFGSDGTMAQSLGTWDEKTRSMTWTYQTKQVKIVTVEKFADDDTIVWHDVVTNEESKVIGGTHGQKKRSK